MSIPAAQSNFIYRKEGDNYFLKKDETYMEMEKMTIEAKSKTQLTRINSSICKPCLNTII